MRSITIREFQENDLESIFGIIKQWAIFEKAIDQLTNSVEQIRREKDCFKCLVAEDDNNRIVWIAMYYFVYYSWVGKSMYLEDITVDENSRRQGIGTMLLNEIFKVAENEACNRLRWQVLDWNEPAIKMYEKIWANITSEWNNCDFDQKWILDFNKKIWS